MRNVPTTALLLGLAGLIPFVWGALTYLNAGLANWGASALGPRFVGPYIQLAYGAVILSFMSGVLWGFASKTSGARAAIGYILSVIPALWAFFMTGGGPVSAGTNLIWIDQEQDILAVFRWVDRASLDALISGFMAALE